MSNLLDYLLNLDVFSKITRYPVDFWLKDQSLQTWTTDVASNAKCIISRIKCINSEEQQAVSAKKQKHEIIIWSKNTTEAKRT